MKKLMLFLLTAIISVNCYTQISYEKGYFIDNSNKKTDCFIKNIDWKNNPISFEYKLSINGESKSAQIKSIQEFGINGISTYIRSVVKIDRSRGDTDHLTDYKSPLFKEEQLFLKVLVQGKANLYLFENGNLRRYFFNKENSKIEQLVFKNYLTDDGKLGKNNQFRQQLWNSLKCPTIKMNRIKNLEYKKNSLINLFVEYNKCNDVGFINKEKQKKKDLFNLTLRPRINNSSLTIQNYILPSKNNDLGNKFGIGFGVEAEFILPYNKNKWAIIAEPTYQYFKANKTTNVNNVVGLKLITLVDYKSIEIPIGIRHYFFLNNNSKIFTNFSYVVDLVSNSSIEFKRSDNSNLSTLEINTTDNFALGLGYKFDDKYSLEMRYYTGRNILRDYLYWGSDYKTFSVIVGYSLF